MFNLNRALYAFLNRWFPEQAWRFVPRAPSHLQLTPQQARLMNDAGIYRIKLEYRNLGGLVARSYWTTWEKDGNLTWEALRELPRDVLLIARNASGAFEIHAGPGYESMSEVQFENVVNHLLKSAQESIAYIDHLDRAANARNNQGSSHA